MCNLAICLFIAILFVGASIPVSFGQQWKCVNNPLLSSNALWNCVERTKCKFTNSVPAGKLVRCGAQSICCPSPLNKTRITPPTQAQINETNSIALNESNCVNNTLLSSNLSWKCVKEKNCQSTNSIPAIKKVSCGAQSICCPSPLNKTNITHPTPAQINEANSIALNECHKYEKYRYHNWTDYGVLIGDPIEERSELDCKPVIEGFIANGNPVREKEYPFMALLSFSDDVSDETGWKCDGTLISSQYILTAAQCTKMGVNTTVKWALLGKLSRTNITQELRHKNLFKVDERIKHPLYKAGKSEQENNDIALLKLEQEVPLSSSIRPICLYYNKTKVHVNSTVIVAGWEINVAGEKESGYFQKVPMKILKSSSCVENIDLNPEFRNSFDNTTMICGGDLQNGGDSRPGDLGAPMLIAIKDYPCMYLQVGVLSRAFWPWNGEAPSIYVYTRVSHYIPWIRSVAWSST